MTRQFLGVPVWRWSACLTGAALLVVAVVFARLGFATLGFATLGFATLGGCLTGATPAALGHCPLCWAAMAAFFLAAAPTPAGLHRVLSRIRARRG